MFLQAVLFLLIVAGPQTAPWLPTWSPAIRSLASAAGAVLMSGGLLWVVAGAVGLRSHLTPLPCPKDNGRLIETGAYALVRHPMYCGATWWAVGWALSAHGLLTLVYAVMLSVFLDAKASREERWLCVRFPEYLGYQRRVRKLIPFVY